MCPRSLYDFNYSSIAKSVATPLLEECEDDIHTLKMGTSEFNYRGQNTSPWNILHVIGKILKCKCQKWPRTNHLDIYNTSYGKKKGQESNWQFDSRPLKVGNRPEPGVCRWNATHHWKVFKESYKFASDLIPIGGLSKELWTHKVPGAGTCSRSLFTYSRSCNYLSSSP